MGVLLPLPAYSLKQEVLASSAKKKTSALCIPYKNYLTSSMGKWAADWIIAYACHMRQSLKNQDSEKEQKVMRVMKMKSSLIKDFPFYKVNIY
jgi:hypothetical protein